MNIEQLGPYRLGKVLGRGGMGTVYLGTHETSGELAAVKVVTPNLACDDAFRDRFEAEVHSLEKLHHPHIVELLGFGEQTGTLFFVMEYVDGRTLQQEMAAGRRFHWREVVGFGIAICQALKHAHDHGVIHRDIKPANLLLNSREMVKLTDFGIAKLFGRHQMTADGGVMGTADYMSPEQAAGESVSTRCDLYSVGAVLYALLSGRPPFLGKSLPEVVHKVRFEQPIPIGRLVADVPRELELVLDQLLQKDPRRRIPTALALANRLQAIQHALSIDRPPADQTGWDETEVAPWIDDSTPHDVQRRVAEQPTSMYQGPAAGATVENAMPKAPASQHPLSNQETQVPESVPADVPPDGARSDQTRSDQTPSDAKLAAQSFVQVDEAYRQRQRVSEPEHGESRWERVTKWGSLVGFLALVIGLSWFVFKPPTADRLHESIQTTMDKHGVDGVMQVDGEIRQFLRRFPDDPRRAEIEQLQTARQLVELERKLRVRARSTGLPTGASVLEPTMVRIMYLERAAPTAAATELRALLDVYASGQNLSDADRRCLALAEKWLERLEPELRATQEALRETTRQQLVHANQIQSRDPRQAREIRQGVVTLYEDQPWASDLVRQAQEQLGPANQPTGLEKKP